jgi:pimeloyl-ACP methyl ester carboxylesterase
VIDQLASAREVTLFDNAGVGRSTGSVPETVAAMATHTFAFLDALGLDSCDVLGFSLGGMVVQQMLLDRPSIFRRMILVATAPRGGEDIMHLEKPSLAQYINDPGLRGSARLQDEQRRSGSDIAQHIKSGQRDAELRGLLTDFEAECRVERQSLLRQEVYGAVSHRTQQLVQPSECKPRLGLYA